jgi:regulatory protein
MAPPQAPPPPDAANLHQAALHYLARYAATEAGLKRVLLKRIDRWVRVQPDRDSVEPAIAAAHQAVATVVANLVRAGAISDTGFAEGRARSLRHSGRSRRAIQASLAAKGVAPDLARDAAGDDTATELAAALILTRRRRIGAFRTHQPDDPLAAERKELGVLARAGFAQDVSRQALRMDSVEAERHIHALRSDKRIEG